MKFKTGIVYCICICIGLGMTSFSTLQEGIIDALTPYPLETPANFPPLPLSKENPLTMEGVALGRKLFYEPLLSRNNKISCGTCHQQQYAFSDSAVFSTGVDGFKGKRNSMPLFNLAWTSSGYFWDGRSESLESQAAEPIKNPVEMHESLELVIVKLQNSFEYPILFKKVFGSDVITERMVTYAIAQFERSIISADSKFDRFIRNEPGGNLNTDEKKGVRLFTSPDKGACVSCHPLNGILTGFTYNDIGLDSIVRDSGRYVVGKFVSEIGKFKTPSLRNIALTAPYMHDGRFQTLEQVMDHYNEGFKHSRNLDKLIYREGVGKGNLTAQEKKCIIQFLKTLTDSTLISDPRFSDPN
jgi:cytochrome c peroxidase